MLLLLFCLGSAINKGPCRTRWWVITGLSVWGQIGIADDGFRPLTSGHKIALPLAIQFKGHHRIGVHLTTLNVHFFILMSLLEVTIARTFVPFVWEHLPHFLLPPGRKREDPKKLFSGCVGIWCYVIKFDAKVYTHFAAALADLDCINKTLPLNCLHTLEAWPSSGSILLLRTLISSALKSSTILIYSWECKIDSHAICRLHSWLHYAIPGAQPWQQLTWYWIQCHKHLPSSVESSGYQYPVFLQALPIWQN